MYKSDWGWHISRRELVATGDPGFWRVPVATEPSLIDLVRDRGWGFCPVSHDPRNWFLQSSSALIKFSG